MQVVPEHMASQATAPSIKVWQAWPGRHQFLCDGRVMVGPDISVTAFAAILTTVSSVAFWTYVCNRLPGYTLAIGCVLFLLTIVFMVKTATTDPGIVPSNRGMEQAEADACAQERRTVEINGVAVPLKWCRTCHIFRPPRAAHCSECNVCVDRFDHHCPWMGQCIGRRNYRYFLGFVISCSALSAYTLTLSALVAYRAASASPNEHGKPQHDFLARALLHSPSAVALVGFPALILLCVGPLACYHCSLVAGNKTTSEELKETYGVDNPFDVSLCHNCNEVCCHPVDPPRLLPRALLSDCRDSSFGIDTCGLIEASPYDPDTRAAEPTAAEGVDSPTSNDESTFSSS